MPHVNEFGSNLAHYAAPRKKSILVMGFFRGIQNDFEPTTADLL